MHVFLSEGESMHPLIEQQILRLFNGRSHIAPIECAASLDWSEQSVYKHQHKNDFPIRQVLIGGRRRVSINDYVDFVLNGPNSNPHDPLLVVKPGRGRPPNKAKAADRKRAKEKPAEKPVTEQSVTEQSVTEQSVTEQSVTEKPKRGRPTNKAVAARKAALQAGGDQLGHA
jgi:hypothetical protein